LLQLNNLPTALSIRLRVVKGVLLRHVVLLADLVLAIVDAKINLVNLKRQLFQFFTILTLCHL